MTTPTANPAPQADTPAADLDQVWAEAAIKQELGVLATLPKETPQKPGSVFSICLLKLASIAKGSGGKHVNRADLLADIIRLAEPQGIPQKEIERQWKRAMQKARPRYRVVQSRPVQSKPNGAGQPPQPATAPSANGKKPMPAIDLKNPKTKDYRLAFEHLDLSFQMNELDDSIWCNGERLDDGREAIIRNRCRDLGLTAVSRIKDAYMQFAYRDKFHPVRDYLDGLKWDGKDWLAVFTTNFLDETTGFGETAFKRWMIGSIAKIYQQGQNYMLVWDGPQGTGKSTLARWLCPLDRFFIEGPVKPEDKDSLIRLASKWIWEVMELQATTRKADKEALKGFITTEEITVRKPYGANDMIKPAMASLIGTINEDGAGFLTDPTGSRRFVIINLKKIDFRYTELPKEQLWAQAVAMYRDGEPWVLNPEERKIQAEINARYEMDSLVSLYFFERFKVTTDPDKFTTAADILNSLETFGLKGNQQANANELGRLMKRLNVESFRPLVDGRRPRAYRGVVPLEEKAPNDEPIPF